MAIIILAFSQVLLILVLGVGWVSNIVKVLGGSFDEVTVQLVLRVVGIFFAPLGAVMGYL